MSITSHSSSPIIAWLRTLDGREVKLTHGARSVALALLQLSNPETGMTDPVSYKTVAQFSGCSRGTLIAALRKLEDAGLIRRFGAHEQVNAYVLTVDAAFDTIFEPGPILEPGQDRNSDSDVPPATEFDPAPEQNLDHKRTSLSPALSSSLPDNVHVLGKSPAVPLSRSWQPTTQHEDAMIALGLPRDTVLEDFVTWAGVDSNKPQQRSNWDRAFGWWINKPEGWKSYRAEIDALQRQEQDEQQRKTLNSGNVPDTDQVGAHSSVSHEVDDQTDEQQHEREFSPVTRLHTEIAVPEHRFLHLVMTSLESYGFTGGRVRDRAIELLDSGVGYWHVTGIIVKENGGELERANGLELISA